MSDCAEKALVLALVREHMLDDPSYLSFVPGYTKVTWRQRAATSHIERVGSHWRRKPLYKKTIDAIKCVCKMPELNNDNEEYPPVGRRRAGKRLYGGKEWFWLVVGGDGSHDSDSTSSTTSA